MHALVPSVGVVVTLPWTPEAGGHVKCWERLAEAAAEAPPGVDLTLYLLGEVGHVTELSAQVRLQVVPPILGTGRIMWLRRPPDDTDLAPHHPRLAGLLARHDVLHATDLFGFSLTARRVARRLGRPLVTSIHTDTPRFSRIYSREVIERLMGRGILGSLVLDWGRLPERAAASLGRRTEGMVTASALVLASNAADERFAAGLVGPARVGRLRRGVDRSRFAPARRDREALLGRLGVGPGTTVFVFAGRVDDTKRVLTAARAVARLADRGLPVHLVLAGEGGRSPDVRALLGARGTLLGRLPQQELAAVLASADAFVFPSDTEVVGNVVIEAMAAGLPPVVAAGTACAEQVCPGRGLVVEGQDPEDWADALAPLVLEAGRARALGEAARAHVERRWPSWREVFLEDLVPVWQALAMPRLLVRRAGGAA